MKKILLLCSVSVICALLLFSFYKVSAQVNVVTHHYNLSRTGANLQEIQLNTSNVNTSTFGILWSYLVKGQVYAQPLYVSGVTIPGVGKKNILYIADMHDFVYAFDADRDTLYWKDSLGISVYNPMTMVSTGYPNILGEIGICSTPVIDTLSRTIYVVAKTEPSSNVYTDSLYALDLATGLPKYGGSEFISASVPGTAYSSGGTLHFIAEDENQRAALTLSNGVVYLCYGSYGDGNSYEGWILGYNIYNIKEQVIDYCTDPNGARVGVGSTYARAAIWMSGQGPSVDSAGNLYVITGNGAFDSTASNDFGDSFLKLTPDTASKTFIVSDWFTPHNEKYLDSADYDLGSDGPVLIPGTNYITASCKQGIIYLVDRNNMGHFHADTDLVKQQVYAFGAEHIVYGSTVFWADNSGNPNTGLTYWWSRKNNLTSFRITNGVYNTTPTAVGISNPNGMGSPGGILCLSANGSTPGSGVLWVTTPISQNAATLTVPGYLMAFDASNVASELWNSEDRKDGKGASLDSVGNFAKFCPPMVTNGKVYVSTFSNKVQAYGLLALLPVNLINFIATKVDTVVRLDWVTASEQNNDHFEIERSANGVSFSQIGIIKGNGNSTITLKYFFYDHKPLSGINFYRLKQVDFDGKSTYSRVASIAFGSQIENDLSIFPNPAEDNFSIRIDGWNPAQINLRMVSMGGETVYQKTFIGNDFKGNIITVQRKQSMGEGYYILFLTDPSGDTKSGKVLLTR
jgi:hypothetical protein